MLSSETLFPVGTARFRLRGAMSRVPPVELRTQSGHERDVRHATPLELFFDLVFVAAIAELTSALEAEPTLTGLARFAGLFVVIWWVWVPLTTYADRFGTEDSFHRGALLLAGLLAIGLAAGAPAAFRGHPTLFVTSYILLGVEQLALFDRARRHVPQIRSLYTSYLVVGVFSVVCWAGSLAVVGWQRYLVWAFAIVIEMATPWVSAPAGRPAPMNVTHIPERFGLFMFIVLGQSVAHLVSATTQRPWTLQLIVVLAAAYGSIVALWWISLRAVDATAVARGPRSALAYMFVQLPMFAGIAAASAGLHSAILAATGGEPIGVGARAAIYGGTAVYLAAAAALPAAPRRRHSRHVRLAASAAALCLVFMGAVVAPVYLVPSLTLVLAVAVLVDRRRPLAASPHS